MYSWCTKEEWQDDLFDIDWCEKERRFATINEARKDAEKHGVGNCYILQIGE